jgi:hypothetical protein
MVAQVEKDVQPDSRKERGGTLPGTKKKALMKKKPLCIILETGDKAARAP